MSDHGQCKSTEISGDYLFRSYRFGLNFCLQTKLQYLVVYALLHPLENISDWLSGFIENNKAFCVMKKEREFNPLIHMIEVIKKSVFFCYINII